MGEPLPIKLYETLVNLLGMYTYAHEEVLVLEAVANGIDAEAKKISIKLEHNADSFYIIFHNDGAPMNEDNFKDYHTISLSSKTKGKSIGFAGVGAKIFLASPKGSEIITTTGEGNNVFVSKMYRRGKDIEHDTSLKIPIKQIIGNQKINHSYGTSYKVKIIKQSYDFLEKNIITILQFWFNYAITSQTLSLIVNGKPVHPWEPKGDKFKKTIKFKNQKIPCYFWICKEEIPEEGRHLVYSVFGKRIRADMVDFSYQIKGDMNNKVFCMADVSAMAEYLTSNKEDFMKNYFTNGVRGAIKKTFYEFLAENNLLNKQLGTQEQTNFVVNQLTKRLDRVLQSSEFKFLNPFSSPTSHIVSIKDDSGDTQLEQIDGVQKIDGTMTGDGNGDGVDTIGDDQGVGYSEKDSGDLSGRTAERKSRGLAIVDQSYPDDPREAWIDPSERVLVYNSGHPFNKKFDGSSLFNYNLTRVCISALIKNRNDQVEWNPATTLEYLEKILHEVWQ